MNTLIEIDKKLKEKAVNININTMDYWNTRYSNSGSELAKLLRKTNFVVDVGKKIIYYINKYNYNDIIEFGSGFGFLPGVIENILKYKLPNYTLIDFAEEAFNAPNDYFKIISDISENICIKNNISDMVIAMEVIEHFPSFITIIQNMHNVLRNNSIAIITTPMLKKGIKCEDHCHRKIDKELLTNILTSIGFEIKEISYYRTRGIVVAKKCC